MEDHIKAKIHRQKPKPVRTGFEEIFLYTIKKIYLFLFKEYGPQGWWPLIKLFINPLSRDWRDGYHPKNYNYPIDQFQIFEICLGVVLTQNTNWNNARKALINLSKRDLLTPNKILQTNKKIIQEAIKPSGYFNQKTDRIKRIAQLFLDLKNQKPTREDLLSIKGIGPESADSILLYGYHQPYFVVDSYTSRIINRIFGLNISKYEEIANIFYTAYLNTDFEEKTKIFNEYHALIVKHAKEFCSTHPRCSDCVIRFLCRSA